MRRSAIIFGFVLVLALALGAQAQFIGNVSPQTTTSLPFNAITCTNALAAGPVLVQNIGQEAHIATTFFNVGFATQFLIYTIQGSYDGLTFFDISDAGTAPNLSNGLTSISGNGYYPVVAVRVSQCVPSTAKVTIQYSGIAIPSGANVGTALNGQILKTISFGSPANTSFSNSAVRSPFGSSAGTLQFTYLTAAGPSGSTVQVSCGSTASGAVIAPITGAFALQTTQNLVQTFQVPATGCEYFIVAYTSGGASTAVFNLDYTFSIPGSAPAAYQYTHITTTTAAIVKGTPGYLHTVSINLGAAGTVSVFDLPSASCTGTPATNQVAIITATASTLQTFTYDVNLLSGICVKASAAMDLTVSAQ